VYIEHKLTIYAFMTDMFYAYHIIFLPSVDPYRITKSMWIWK